MQQYRDFRKRDIELGDIVIERFSNIAFKWLDLSVLYIELLLS